jgi:hypothetical protein
MNIFDNTDNLKQTLKSNDYVLKTFKDLTLIKYMYNKTYDISLQKYFKSTILKDDKIVCMSPFKSIKLDDTTIETLKNINLSENKIECQLLLDGTMVNLFYDNDHWEISTRSSIGGKNKWNNKTIGNLFKECCNYDLIIQNLNKNYSYSFVLQHMDIRNVSIIETNKIILVDVIDINLKKPLFDLKTNFKHLNVDIINNITITSIEDIINKYIEVYENDYNFKGLTFKVFNNNDYNRYSFINPIYLKVKENLTINNTNPLYIFCDLWKTNKLSDHLQIFPENKTLFTKFDDNLKLLLQDLLTTYHSLFIHKTIEKNMVKYQLNPLLYLLHGFHLKNKDYINFDFIKNFMKSVDTQRLVFTLKYYVNK